MTNNMMLGKCLNCGQTYCQECSDHDGWEDYCSILCEREHEEDFRKDDDEWVNDWFGRSKD